MAEVIDFDRARERRPEPLAVDGRVPPHDLDAEAAVLSAVLLASTTKGMGVEVIAGFLQPEHFYSEAHRRIYEGAIEVHAMGRNVDSVTVGSWLKDRERIGQVGGMSYITEILNSAPAVTNKSLLEYATIVHDTWRARQMISTCQLLVARGYHDYGSAQEYADDGARQLVRLSALSVGDRGKSNIEVLTEQVKAMQAAAAAAGKPIDGKHGISFGIPTLDKITTGMHAGEVTEIVGGTGSGKTTFALAVANHVASLGVGVYYFSPELPKSQLIHRLMCARAEVRSDLAKIGKLTTEEWSRWMSAMNAVADLPIEFDDRPSLNVAQIAARVRQAAENARVLFKGKALGLVVVDHLHELEKEPGVRFSHRNERYDSLLHSADRIKKLANDTLVPTLLLAQMKTFDAKGTQLRPPLGSTEHCKAVEQKCDRVINIWTPWHKPTGGGRYQPDQSRRFLLVVKKRLGSFGEVEVKTVAQQDRYIDEAAQTDDTVNPMLPVSRAYVDMTPAARTAEESSDFTNFVKGTEEQT
jgi:replicative DNA helicase